MTHIKIKKGLDIPIIGKPKGDLITCKTPAFQALDVSKFAFLRFNILVKEGDSVKIGQPLLEDKKTPGRFFVSPASGEIVAFQRGLKRRLLSVVIKTDGENSFFPIDPSGDLIDTMMQSGIFSMMRKRPCNVLADPTKLPKSIFIKAIESAPFAPHPEMQIQGLEANFQKGLDALASIAPCHLVCRNGFEEYKNVTRHTAEGPHPISSQSIHIEKIDPIYQNTEVVWTLDCKTVACLGRILLHGEYDPTSVISIAGEGIKEEKRGFYRVYDGTKIEELIHHAATEDNTRFISGDLLTGTKVNKEDFLGFLDNGLTAIPEEINAGEPFHFLKLGLKKYSFFRSYFSSKTKKTRFSTLQHGEERAFVDGSIYEKVMPLQVSTMHLIKSLLAEDFEKAEELGLLEVAPEDFALPSFICPSKIEMGEIVENALIAYHEQYL